MQEGPASGSYGLEVARLAGIPNEILTRAEFKSHHMRSNIPNRAFSQFCLEWKTTLESCEMQNDAKVAKLKRLMESECKILEDEIGKKKPMD